MGEILAGLPKGQETLMAVESPGENNTMVAMKKDNIDSLYMPNVLYWIQRHNN